MNGLSSNHVAANSAPFVTTKAMVPWVLCNLNFAIDEGSNPAWTNSDV